MTSVAGVNTMMYSELVLKTMPPRASRHQLARPRLSLADKQFHDRSVIAVQAQSGFGKTSLLVQWRREYLAKGAAVAWVTADAGYDLQRFLHTLVLAVRMGCGRPGFGRLLLESAGTGIGELEGVTAWLAEVAQTSLKVVLMIDDAESLSASNFSALTYLMRNVTPNLNVVVAARTRIDAAIADLLDYGQALLLGAEDLRFKLDETISLARNRFSAKLEADTAARLHELTEGWPLGLQIVMAAMEKSDDLRASMATMLGGGGGRSDRLVGGLLANLTAADVDFLVRISCVDLIHPEMCSALTGLAGAQDRLANLVRETPVFVTSDESVWVRLHNLVRDALRSRLANLQAEEQIELHLRAMRWFVEHGMLQQAARHALAAGQCEVAYDLAEQCLYDAVTQGHQEMVLQWLDRLPAAELKKRPKLRLAAAWALALSERHGEAEALVRDILDDPALDASLRYECALIASGAAYYADDPDRYVELFQPWVAVAPPSRDQRLVQMHVNRQAVLAILAGDPARARRHIQMVFTGDFGQGYRYGVRWGDFIIGLSYMWEGQVVLAEEVLRPALASADTDLGRRHPLACMIASVLAAAVFEQDCLDEASELLANRLDVLERAGTPETAMLGYRTAARIAAAQGSEHRALDLLEAMYAMGVARHLPRLCVMSLGEQVRMHAGRFRSETCRALVQRIDEIVAEQALAKGPLWRAAVELLQRLAHANAAIAAQDWRTASANLAQVLPMAEAVRLNRYRIEIMALHAFAMDRLGENTRPQLFEAINLAQTFSLSRTFVDAHPALADWVRRAASEEGADRITQMAHSAVPAGDRPRAPPRALPSMVLTPKEREVLEHLARNLSNKEIANAMEVGEETVKWHLKNLFGKLDAGTRKHAVRRAQLLGLLEGME